MSNYQRVLLLFCYTLSGMISLGYEVLWARMLSLQFGVSIFGVVVTVAAFMLGLGLGSLAGTVLARRSRLPLRLFAVMELSVAIYALLLPLIFRAGDHWLGALSGDLSVTGWFVVQGGALLVLMLVPALAMGMAFPLILRGLDQFSGSLALLYGLNACGGAIGALLPLFLLPAFGWTMAVRILAVVGCLIAVIVFLFTGRQHRAVDEDAATSRPGSKVPTSALICYAGIGAAALILEIGWTRLYGMIMLRTEYILALILAVYLVGIGAGSLFARWLRRPVWALIMPVLAAGYATLSLWLLPTVSAWVERSEWGSLLQALILQGGVLVLLTLPVTLVLGAWLPVLVGRIEADAGAPGHSQTGACLYGANSIGAAAGALLTGFVLIPWLGTMATMAVAMLLLLFCGLYFAPRSRIAWVLPPVLLGIVWPVSDFPAVASLLPDSQADSRDLYRYEDAVSITHVVEQASGQRLLLSDLQRMDASTEPTAVALQKNQARLPLLLHGGPHSVLFLGLGTGITASGSLPLEALQRTAVELSRGAIAAAGSQFAAINGHIVDSMRVVNHDGRYFLRSCRQKYDVIVGDVFHPDMVGRSALLSVEQFERGRDCLNDDGWFVQWLALNQFDVEDLRVVLRSFVRVFPDMLVFIDGFRLAMAGLRSSTSAGRTSARMRGLLDSLKPDEAQALTGGEGRMTWLGRFWGRPDPGSGALQHEWSPQIEFSLPAARFRGDINVAKVMDWLLRQRPPAGRAAAMLGVSKADYPDFERAYMATTLAFGSWQARLLGHEADAERLIRFAYNANSQDRWAGLSLADDMLETLPQAVKQGIDRRQALEAILAVRPDHVDTLYELWRLAQTRGDAAEAGDYLSRLRQLAPLDSRFRQSE